MPLLRRRGRLPIVKPLFSQKKRFPLRTMKPPCWSSGGRGTQTARITTAVIRATLAPVMVMSLALAMVMAWGTKTMPSPNVGWAALCRYTASVDSKQLPVPPELGQQQPAFTFPSAASRVAYYMGAWNDADWASERVEKASFCDDLKKIAPQRSDAARSGKVWKELYSWTRRELEDEERVREGYRNDLLRMMDLAQGLDLPVIYVGDTPRLDEAGRLPVISKSREARMRSTNPYDRPAGIIWPVNLHRHYKGIEEVTSLRKSGQGPRWSEKRTTLVWRGVNTGQYVGALRMKVLLQYGSYDRSEIDVGLVGIEPTIWAGVHYDDTNLYRPMMSIRDLLEYKYLLSIEGNDVATGLKWMLYSDSVVFMSRPKYVSFAMEDILVPFLHYIPVADDYSNLIEMVQWAKNHDGECQNIAKASTEFVERLWVSAQAQADRQEIEKQLAVRYRDAFQEKIMSCSRAHARNDEQVGSAQLLLDQGGGTVGSDVDWVKTNCFEPLPRPILGTHDTKRIINVGLPKCGTTSLHRALSKVDRMSVSNWKCSEKGMCGMCIGEATRRNQPPLASCGNYVAYTQMDYVGSSGSQEGGTCIFPQISFLRDLYEENPTATLILPHRNVTEWIGSISRWGDLRRRLADTCEFPAELNFSIGMANTDERMLDLFCNHVVNIRQFVRDHPTLSLVEFDIGSEKAGDILASTIPGFNRSYWGAFRTHLPSVV